MKKSSIGLLLLSVLICLSMLLISCDSKDKAQATQDPFATAEPAPEDVKIDTATVFEKWNQYLTFSSPIEEKPLLNTASLKFSHQKFNHESPYPHKTTSSLSGAFYTVTKVNYEYDKGYDYDPVASKYTYTVYSVESGKDIFSRSITIDPSALYNPTCTIKTLSVSTSAGTTYLPILEVRETAWNEALSESAATYSYYNEKGEALKTGLNEKLYANFNAEDNTVTLEFNGKIHVYDLQGEHIFTFAKGEEKLIPTAWREFGDYLYAYTDNTVFVFDSSYRKLCDYTPDPAFTDAEPIIMSNGNLLYAYVKAVPEKAEGDFEAEIGYANGDGAYNEEEFKASLSYVIVDVKTGKETVLKRDFAASGIMTAVHEEETGIGFKSADHQMALIQKIENGALSNNKSIVILDKDLNIVEELPVLIKAQDDVLRMLDESKLLIASKNYNESQALYYTFDISTKEVELFVNDEKVDEYVDGGLIENGKLYNNELKELLDLSDYESYTSYGSFIIANSTSLFYIENGELIQEDIILGGGSYEVRGDIILVSDSANGTYKVYNVQGKLLHEFHDYNKPIIRSIGDGYAWIMTGGESDSADIYYLK